VQNVNFFLFGSLMIGYGIGLHFGVRPNRRGGIGLALLVVSGIGIITAGAFPWRAAEGAFIEPVGHVVGAVMSFVGAGLGLVVMSRRMVGDPRWRAVGAYALASGVAILVLFVAFGALALSAGAPLHPWAGVVQRVTVTVWFACTMVLALRLLRIARA
jgi:hypothetical membrane protein